MNEPQRPSLTLPGLPKHLRDIPQQPADTREREEDRIDRETTARRHRHQRYYRRLPKRYRDARTADLDALQDVQGKVSGWLASGHQTLLLASEKPSIGKTHAAYAVGTEAVEAGLWVEAWTAIDLLSAVRREMDQAAEERAYALDDVLRCDLLILDDIGRENATPWAQEQLHHVLDVRLRENRRTIVTTNLTSEAMTDRYGAPMLDRLLDDAVIVKVTGEPRRRPVAW